MNHAKRYNIDFSSAIRNRTGKFTIGSFLIEDQKSHIDRVYYWRLSLKGLPNHFVSRILDTLTKVELKLKIGSNGSFPPPHSFPGPAIHLDPYTTIYSSLTPQDIVIVHDVGPVTNPDLFSDDVSSLYHNAFSLMVKADVRIVFVSQSSMLAFRNLYGTTTDMRVIYPPIGYVAPHSKKDPVAAITKPFLLTVGSIGRRKNQRRCIEAFIESGLANEGYTYVLCGAREPGAEEVEALARNATGVTLLPYVSSTQLAWLYSHAKGFVLMSELEGFGMPVAEAILNGLIPLVTADSVLTEVAGQHAIVANYKDISQIARGMQSLAFMAEEERRYKTIKLGNHISAFSRSEFAKQWRIMLSS